MKRATLAVLTLALAGSFAPAMAQRGERWGHDGPRSDTARVLHVEPLFRMRDREYVRQECWNERTGRNEAGYYRDDDGRLYREGRDSNKAGAVIGAIVGGVLGNQVGDGRGRTAATIAGAAAGAAVGARAGDRDDDRYDDYAYYRSDDGIERRCRTVTTYAARDRRGDRFRVTYAYGGQTYRTVTDYHPGRSMRVLVDVQPQDNRVADHYDD
jgi:uncharacterized protein YcfJ